VKTEILKIQSDNIDNEKIKYAAEVLRGGALWLFPLKPFTDLEPMRWMKNAVKKIFES